MKKRKALDARKKVPECVINHTNDKLIIQMDDKDKYSQIPVCHIFFINIIKMIYSQIT